MKNTRIITALEECKTILIDEIRNYIKGKNVSKIKCNIHLPIYVDDTYGLDGYWSGNIVKSIYLRKKDNDVRVKYTDGEDEFDDSLSDCFIVGEIAQIIDYIDYYYNNRSKQK